MSSEYTRTKKEEATKIDLNIVSIKQVNNFEFQDKIEKMMKTCVIYLFTNYTTIFAIAYMVFRFQFSIKVWLRSYFGPL